MKISIINGPNLNLVGTREPHIYGTQSLDDYLQTLKNEYATLAFTFFQSNIEGEIINEIQHQGATANTIIINAGAYTHTSYAIADALKAISCKQIIEVHISNIYSRESYRRESKIAEVCMASLCGFGLKGYRLAIESLL
jgi:3-dehydroquinate dehydratase II